MSDFTDACRMLAEAHHRRLRSLKGPFHRRQLIMSGEYIKTSRRAKR